MAPVLLYTFACCVCVYLRECVAVCLYLHIICFYHLWQFFNANKIKWYFCAYGIRTMYAFLIMYVEKIEMNEIRKFGWFYSVKSQTN